jgi:hypothetical protein
MSLSEMSVAPVSPELVATLANESLLLAAEGLGLRAAIEMKSELRSVTAARAGRVAVIGEADQGAVELIAHLVEAPRLAAALTALPRVHTTYRFGPSPSVLCLTGASGERELTLADDVGSRAQLRAVLADMPSRVLQVDVRVHAALLSWFSVTHLPDLNSVTPGKDPLSGMTPSTKLMYVKSASAPLSAVEVRLIRQARRCVGKVALVLTGADRYPGCRQVAEVDRQLLTDPPEDTGAPVTVLMLGNEPEPELTELRCWLSPRQVVEAGAAVAEALGMVGNVAKAVRAACLADPVPAPPTTRDKELHGAEEQLARVTRESMAWLPRLGFTFTRLRSEEGERRAQALAQLEQRHEQWIQSDVREATERLPDVLLKDLRGLQEANDRVLADRIEAIARDFLGERIDEFLTDRLGHGPESTQGPNVQLVGVSQAHWDGRTELFASFGNFSSGRQSLSILGSVASAAAGPIALVGGVIGLGFWRLGRQSRQESLARAQASRWLKVQVAEAGRRLAYRIDQRVNEAQLVMNLAARDYYERVVAESRQSVEAHRRLAAGVDVLRQSEAERAAELAERARLLIDRCAAIEVPLDPNT